MMNKLNYYFLLCKLINIHLIIIIVTGRLKMYIVIVACIYNFTTRSNLIYILCLLLFYHWQFFICFIKIVKV